jgi:hypothetical protein
LFFNIFSTFDHLFKDLKVVHAIHIRERQQTNMKSPRNLGKGDIWWQSSQVTISHTIDMLLFLIFKR